MVLDLAGRLDGHRRGSSVHICSGTLIDEDVFLTAGHCTDFLSPEDEVFVSFAVDVDPIPNKLLPGDAFTHPRFGHDQSNPFDIAVVDLDRSVSGLEPASIPEVGLFDQMKAAGTLKGSKYTAVGYGVHEPERGGGPPEFPYDGMRWRSVSSFSALNDAWLRLSQNDARRRGDLLRGLGRSESPGGRGRRDGHDRVDHRDG